MIKNWNTRNFKAEILDQLEENGEIVGKLVETEARRRLVAIQDPEWGAGYREKIVARLLRYEVERNSNEVVIDVGVAQTGKSKHHGLYIELGSKTAPAQPFLRPAVFENGRKIVALLSGR